MDLQPAIRSFLLSDQIFSGYLSSYSGSKALFTRRPVPTDAAYPLAVISPIVTYKEQDFIGKKNFTLTHDVLIFDTNESPNNYRNVEAAAFRIRTIMHRLDRTTFTMPSGYNLQQCLATEPLPGPIDDLIKVSRVVMLTFNINEE